MPPPQAQIGVLVAEREGAPRSAPPRAGQHSLFAQPQPPCRRRRRCSRFLVLGSRLSQLLLLLLLLLLSSIERCCLSPPVPPARCRRAAERRPIIEELVSVKGLVEGLMANAACVGKREGGRAWPRQSAEDFLTALAHLVAKPHPGGEWTVERLYRAVAEQDFRKHIGNASPDTVCAAVAAVLRWAALVPKINFRSASQEVMAAYFKGKGASRQRRRQAAAAAAAVAGSSGGGRQLF